MSRTGNKRRTKGRKRFAGLLIAVVLIAAGAGTISVRQYDKAADPGDPTAYEFVVERGMSSKAIARALQEKGLIKNASLFLQKTKRQGFDGRYQAGSFQLSPSMTMSEIMQALTHARRDTVRFTVPEGYTVRETAALLAEKELVDEQAFLQCLTEEYDYGFLPDIERTVDRLEGYLFPDTYEIFVGAEEREIIEKMLARFDDVFLPEYYSRADELGRSVHEMITIASLIEKETRAPHERKLVSSVLYNRLAIRMNLRFDSTIQYLFDEPKERVLYKDLEIDSPYNTYMYEGLPPGPIASPGKDCIVAALYPEDTDYLYFVVKTYGSIEHNFAVTEQEFNRYKKTYIDSLP